MKCVWPQEFRDRQTVMNICMFCGAQDPHITSKCRTSLFRTLCNFTHKTHTRHTQDCYKDTHKIVIRMLQRHTQTITKISQTFWERRGLRDRRVSESAGIDTILCGDPYRSLWGSLISLIISSRRKILHTRHTQDTHKIVIRMLQRHTQDCDQNVTKTHTNYHKPSEKGAGWGIDVCLRVNLSPGRDYQKDYLNK